MKMVQQGSFTGHYVNDVPMKTADDCYNMVVEIPAGTLEKWQTDAVSGEFYHDAINGVPRVINFLPYPMNYGFVPQTLLSRADGGDGDPTDIVTLAPARPRGGIDVVRVIGALHLEERGEIDTKIIALLPHGPFADIHDLPDLLYRYPGAVEIIRLWFEGYKGPGAFVFKGYANAKEAAGLLEAAHQAWKQETARTP
jgi:inorganic pyrophosphatase